MPPNNPKLASHQAAYGIKVYLVLGDGGGTEKKYPVVSVSIEYALNQIPIANVVLPAGKKISNDSELDINSLNINRRVKAKLILTGEGQPHPTVLKSSPEPLGNVSNLVIFDGYVGAVHYQFSSNSVSSTLVLFHWMHDLDISTVASGDFLKTAPSEWFGSEPGTENPRPNNVFLYKLAAPGSSDSSYLYADDILTLDWWEEIFKPGFYYKANQPLSRFVRLSSQSREPNTLLINALARVKSDNRLKLNERAQAGLNASPLTKNQLGIKFSQIVMEAEGGSSAFEKIVGLSREFKFVLAPRVSDCIVKEYNPVGPIRKTLTADDFDFAGSSPNPTVLPAAALLYGLPSENLFVYSPNSPKQVDNGPKQVDNGFVGQFPNPIAAEGIATGPFLIVPTPSWMHALGSGSQFVSKQGIAILPDIEQPPSNSNSNLNPPSTTNFRVFADAYTQAVYYDNLFSAKTQDIVCGFRTDIELGDCILLKVEEQKGKFYEKRGVVNSINHIFSAGDSPRVNTVIRLKHVFDGSDMDYFGVRSGIPHAFFVGKN